MTPEALADISCQVSVSAVIAAALCISSLPAAWVSHRAAAIASAVTVPSRAVFMSYSFEVAVSPRRAEIVRRPLAETPPYHFQEFELALIRGFFGTGSFCFLSLIVALIELGELDRHVSIGAY